MPNDVDTLYNRCISYARLGLHAEAVKDREHVTELDAESGEELRMRFLTAPAGYCDLGYSELEEGNLDVAFQKFTIALGYDPEYWEALLGKAVIFNARTEYDEALECLEQILQLDPENPIALINRSSTYFGQEQYDKAEADLSRVIELDPEDIGAYERRAILYRRIDEIEKAKADEATVEKLKAESEPDEPQL